MLLSLLICSLIYKCSVTDCPLSEAYYAQTGDLSDLPLLCQYPVKVLRF